MKYFLIIIFCLWAIPATALDSVQVLEATGDITFVWSMMLPTAAVCFWDNLDSPATSFHANTVDDGFCPDAEDYRCLDSFCSWSVHCDNDSLAYYGSWPEFEYSESYAGHVMNHYFVTLYCRVSITDDTKLTVKRHAVSETALRTNIATIQLTYDDGSAEWLLEDGVALDDYEAILQPGIYEIELYAKPVSGPPLIDETLVSSYSGFVGLKWENPDPLSESALTWGTIKSLYR